MTGAIVYRWGAGIPGREAKGLEVFGQAIAMQEERAKSGRIHGHREYIALTGTAGGFMIVEGEVAELMQLITEPESLKLHSQAESIVQDFQVQVYGGGSDQSVQEMIGNYLGGLQELGYL